MSRLPAFKIDENLPREAAELFKSNDIDACHVLDQGMGGIDDFDLAKVCAGERRAILTLDLDFADIRKYPPADHQGILVLRLANEARANVVAVLRNVLELLARRSPVGQLWVIDEGGVRVRTKEP
jgi:predicted nuclease of predicted toxin-antitoxin system